LPDKRIFYQRPDERGDWINNLDGVRLVPYNLHRLVQSTEPILWVEGPKDAETLITLGFLATTCAHGAQGWRPEYAEYFRGRCIYALRDNDAPGLKLREALERDTVPVAKCIHRVELPGLAETEDVTDWLAKGHTLEELIAVLGEAGNTQVLPVASVAVEPVSASAEGAVEERPRAGADLALPPFPKEAWTGIFADYRDLVGPTTEAPDSLHWATLFVTVGLFIGRDRYLCTPHPLYPNSFVLVVGATGDVRKSTALEYGQELWSLLEADLRLATGVVSAEGLYDVLAEKDGTRLLIFEDELRNLLAAAQRPGTRNLLSQLCYLHRCPHPARLTRRESTVAERPVVSLIGATTPKWISAGLEEEAVFGGFFNRCLVITGEPKPYMAHPEPPPHEALAAFAGPLRELKVRLGQGAQRLAFDPEAHERWSEWYVAWRDHRKSWAEEHQALTRRTEDHIRKVALVYAVVSRREAITLDDLERAIAVGEHCETLSLRLLAGITLPKATRLQERILSLIPPEGITRRALQQRIGGNYTREEFTKALAILEELGEIESADSAATRGPGGRRVKRIQEWV
jgi:hypothetical protein